MFLISFTIIVSIFYVKNVCFVKKPEGKKVLRKRSHVNSELSLVTRMMEKPSTSTFVY